MQVLKGALSRAGVAGEGGVTGLAEGGTALGVVQKRGEELGKGSEVGDLKSSASLQEEFDERFEVFHVRSEEDGFFGERGFGGVLATVSEEAFADDDEIAEVLPGVEFACGVDEQNPLG